MYTKIVFDIFFEENPFTVYYKNGEAIAIKDENGLRLEKARGEQYDPLTRAKGYRYWEKHFPDQYCWTLPQELQDALDMPPATSGVFIDKNGELMGYEG